MPEDFPHVYSLHLFLLDGFFLLTCAFCKQGRVTRLPRRWFVCLSSAGFRTPNFAGNPVREDYSARAAGGDVDVPST